MALSIPKACYDFNLHINTLNKILRDSKDNISYFERVIQQSNDLYLKKIPFSDIGNDTFKLVSFLYRGYRGMEFEAIDENDSEKLSKLKTILEKYNNKPYLSLQF